MKYNSDIQINCNPGVYEPAEDSLLLIEILEVKSGDRLLDMGTGTGIIALHAANAGANVTAVDINPKAIICARQNAKKNNLKIKVVKSDLFSNIKGEFDTITFNPPYLPSEGDGSDDSAWSGGKSGAEIIIQFLEDLTQHLRIHGKIYMIISSLSSINTIYPITKKKGYEIKILDSKQFFFETIQGIQICYNRSRNSKNI